MKVAARGMPQVTADDGGGGLRSPLGEGTGVSAVPGSRTSAIGPAGGAAGEGEWGAAGTRLGSG